MNDQSLHAKLGVKEVELVVVLEEDDKKNQIIPSSIENTENREKYIWILDGGKETFQKREQKYRINL